MSANDVEIDCVKTMRNIRKKLTKKLQNNPEKYWQDLEDIRIKYGFYNSKKNEIN